MGEASVSEPSPRGGIPTGVGPWYDQITNFYGVDTEIWVLSAMPLTTMAAQGHSLQLRSISVIVGVFQGRGGWLFNKIPRRQVKDETDQSKVNPQCKQELRKRPENNDGSFNK